MKPKISILTPTWNRRGLLEKLYNSLEAQSSKEFLWIIADDGSTDGTIEFLRNVSSKASFKIRIISSSLRVGKTKLDNLLLNSVNTEFYLNCDSDDFLLPDAIEDFINVIKEIREDININFIIAFNSDVNGIMETKINYTFNQYVNFEEIKNIFSGDLTMLLRTSKFKSIRHLEVDFIVTESMAYSKKFDKLRGYIMPIIVKIMDRKELNSVSYSKGIKYCRGSAYSLKYHLEAILHDNLKCVNIIKLKDMKMLARYTINGDLSFRFYWDFIEKYKYSIYMGIYAYICGKIYSLYDEIFGKLEKTHIEFNENINKSNIFEIIEK